MTQERRHGLERGAVIVHVRTERGAAIPPYLNFSPESLGAELRGGATVRIVTIPDAIFARAVEAGGKLISLVEDKEYGWRVGRLVDPFGHHWEIGKPLG